MARTIACVALILGMLAALAEISSFLMDKGGIIISMVRPMDAEPQACPPDKNPVVEMICKDKRDGPIRLDRYRAGIDSNAGRPRFSGRSRVTAPAPLASMGPFAADGLAEYKGSARGVSLRSRPT